MFFKSRIACGISEVLKKHYLFYPLKNVYRNCLSPPKKSARHYSESLKHRNRTTLYYVTGGTMLVLGVSYGTVPLYRLYCQATGKGGKAEVAAASERVEKMKKNTNRLITVRFNADTASSMAWNFKPQMSQIKVNVGETALAFYTAKNPLDVPVVGIATYNVLPFEAGQYFNKIQCFCFEEQQLNPHEQVDMPVFFYLDPDYAEDPLLENVDEITLSYMFFEAKEGTSFSLQEFFSRKK